ncbi:MAG: hypothetical protein AAB355_03410 [Patescibacteria group bacterium]
MAILWKTGMFPEEGVDMEKTENRKVVVKYCDFCGDESQYLGKCVLCKKQMCYKDGMKAHSAFSLELYRYEDAERIVDGHICRDCSTKVIGVTVQELLNEMIGSAPARAEEYPNQRIQPASDMPEFPGDREGPSILVR